MPQGIYQRKPFSEQTRKKMSINKIGNKFKLGVKLSEETKQKMSEARKREKNYNWKGGISNTSAKRWKEKNKKRVIFLNTRRRIIKENTIGNHVFGEWQTLKAQYNWTCPCCHKSETEIKLTEDHIIPLSKGGSNNIENIQPLCGSCNSIKHNKIIKYEF